MPGHFPGKKIVRIHTPRHVRRAVRNWRRLAPACCHAPLPVRSGYFDKGPLACTSYAPQALEKMGCGQHQHQRLLLLLLLLLKLPAAVLAAS